MPSEGNDTDMAERFLRLLPLRIEIYIKEDLIKEIQNGYFFSFLILFDDPD